MSPNLATRYDSVDALRGICALLVALLHCQTNSHLVGVAFFANAYLFVDFFFVLSGFVIAANYAGRLRDGYGIGRFALLRLGRVYPLYLVTLLAFVSLELVQLAIPSLGSMGATEPFAAPRQSLDTIIANLLLLQSFGTYPFLTWNTPGWSIATEFWTYLAFALVVRFYYSWRVAILASTLVIGVVAVGGLSAHGINTTFDYGFLRTLAGFSAGALAFEAWQRWSPALSRFSPPPFWHVGTVIEITAVLAVIGFVAGVGQGPLSLVAPVLFSGVVLVFIAEAGQISRLLKLRPLQALGALSYSIYMVHLFIGTVMTKVGLLLQSKLGVPLLGTIDYHGEQQRVLGTTAIEGDLWLLAIIVVVIAVSAVSYRFVETPCRDFVRDRVGGRRRQVSAPSTPVDRRSWTEVWKRRRVVPTRERPIG